MSAHARLLGGNELAHAHSFCRCVGSELKLNRGQVSHLSAELLRFLTKKFEDKSVNLPFERCTFWQIS